jgi:nitroreductase
MLEIIRKRRSIRSYLSRPVEDEKISELLRAAMCSPTARGLRPWEFVVVKDPSTLKALSESTPFSSFVKEAPAAIVICFDALKGKRFKEDCSIAAAFIYLEAVNQGLGTCYVQISDAAGRHGEAEAYVKTVLGIPEHVRVQCLMPIGYPDRTLAEHDDSRFERSKIHFERF